jgi:hypothetical protein
MDDGEPVTRIKERERKRFFVESTDDIYILATVQQEQREDEIRINTMSSSAHSQGRHTKCGREKAFRQTSYSPCDD